MFMSPRRIVHSKPEIPPDNLPLPGIRDGVETVKNMKDLTTTLGSIAVKATKRIHPDHVELFRTRIMRDPNATEQEIDQGHGWIKVREPVEQPKSEHTLSTGPVESQFTDAGSDLAAEYPPYTEADSVDSRSADLEMTPGHQEARDVVKSIREQSILNKYSPSPAIAQILTAADNRNHKD